MGSLLSENKDLELLLERIDLVLTTGLNMRKVRVCNSILSDSVWEEAEEA